LRREVPLRRDPLAQSKTAIGGVAERHQCITTLADEALKGRVVRLPRRVELVP
jgi:hypothetical protein